MDTIATREGRVGCSELRMDETERQLASRRSSPSPRASPGVNHVYPCTFSGPTHTLSLFFSGSLSLSPLISLSLSLLLSPDLPFSLSHPDNVNDMYPCTCTLFSGLAHPLSSSGHSPSIPISHALSLSHAHSRWISLSLSLALSLPLSLSLLHDASLFSPATSETTLNAPAVVPTVPAPCVLSWGHERAGWADL